ncbi:hypothetical protein [Streptomyces noursei]|uniref:hypothetical protein n=1 Tax=Streptomyces noursei TaxID=1971 RepID=UPI0037F77CEB
MGLALAGEGEGGLELGADRMRVLIFSQKILSRGMPCTLSASNCDCSSWVRWLQRAYPMRSGCGQDWLTAHAIPAGFTVLSRGKTGYYGLVGPGSSERAHAYTE